MPPSTVIATLPTGAGPCPPHALRVTGWFYPLLEPWPRGTGIFINVGNMLVLHGRRHAKALFTQASAAQSSSNRSSAASSHAASRIFRGVALPEYDDNLWAIEANARGFDSVPCMRFEPMASTACGAPTVLHQGLAADADLLMTWSVSCVLWTSAAALWLCCCYVLRI